MFNKWGWTPRGGTHSVLILQAWGSVRLEKDHDLTTPYLLTSSLLDGTEAGSTRHYLFCHAISCHHAGATALAAEARKLHSNGPKCQELDWSCIPSAVEIYGNRGKEAHDTISMQTGIPAGHSPVIPK
eukprot:Em0011g747a